MSHIANFIVKYKKIILIVFAVLFAASFFGIGFVKVNYNSAEYLPEDSDTKEGLSLMYDAFGDNGNASVMAENIDYDTALTIKEKIVGMYGVKKVLWLDDVFEEISTQISSALGQFGCTITKDTCTKYLLTYSGVLPDISSDDPSYGHYSGFLSILNQNGASLGLDMNVLSSIGSYAKTFYNDNSALFQVTFAGTDYSDEALKAIDEIRTLDYDVYMTGNAAIVNNSVKTVSTQTNLAIIVAAVIVVIILFAMSGSYFEPVVFLVTIGVAVVLNMGTNIFLGDISYLTQSVAGVLQLALTMDYSIFLLHKFRQEKEKGKTDDEAIKAALVQSFSPISASSLTTVCSFIAIMFMSYTIGLDLGIVLAKGVAISYITVFTVLPGLILLSYKLIEKSAHKTFSLSLNRYSNFIIKTRKVLPILFLALIIPCFIFQSLNSFTYSNEASVGSEGSDIFVDKEKITNTFGSQNQVVILLDKTHFDSELILSKQLSEINSVESAVSYTMIEETGIMPLLSADFVGQFRSQDGSCSRILLTLDLPEEGEETTAAIVKIKDALNEQLGEDGFHILGEAASALDIKNIVEKDSGLIRIISISLVALIIMFSFRSILIPILLVFVIEAAIWVNMSFPYILGEPLVFVGYLIVSSILLGSTIDYAILLTSNYTTCRRTMSKFDAIRKAITLSAKAILMSSMIITFAGFSISFISTMPAINVFGSAIGRGGACALVTVMLLLPQLLILFDKPIQKLTIKSKFKN